MFRIIATASFLFLFCSTAQAQSNSKIALKINYGLNGNFFVRQYDEISGPKDKTFLFKKNFIGVISGIDLTYIIGKKSELGLAYSRSINKKEVSYSGQINDIVVAVNNFNIRHAGNFYQLYYQRLVPIKKSTLKLQLGIVYATTSQQEIEINNYIKEVIIQERDFRHNGLEEAGMTAAIEYTRKLDTHFEIGLQVKAYYLMSVQTLEAITLTPTLAYRF